MSLLINSERLRAYLEARLGFRLFAGVQRVDGGVFPVLRPWDLEDNHGFCIALARTPREVTASFHLDGYSGRLLRLMSDADESSRNTFKTLLAAATSVGSRVLVEVNGDAIGSPDERDSVTWRALGIEVSSRLPVRVTEESLHDVAAEAASYCLALALSLIPLEEVDQPHDVVHLPEGAKKRIEVNKYERSPANRAACIAFHGLACKACDMEFGAQYGELGDGYIEVHHLTPVSAMGGAYLVDPIQDLVPLCSNCHSVVHRTNPPLSIIELRSLLESQRARQ